MTTVRRVKSRQRRLRFKASQQPKEPCRECGLTLLSCGASGLCWECADAAWQAGRTAEQPAHRPGNEPDGD